MTKELYIDNQLISFTLSSDNTTWQGSFVLNGKEYQIGTDELNENLIYKIDWQKMKEVLQLIIEKHSILLETSHRKMKSFVKESGLEGYVQLGPLQKLDWTFIRILNPTESSLSFQLYFLPDNVFWVDPYGRWRVTFQNEHLVQVDRIQQ